jgi:hypothetical protein
MGTFLRDWWGPVLVAAGVAGAGYYFRIVPVFYIGIGIVLGVALHQVWRRFTELTQRVAIVAFALLVLIGVLIWYEAT